MVIRVSIIIFIIFGLSEQVNAQVSQGAIDLRSFDFADERTFELNGEWRYVENEFVSPYEAHKIDTYRSVPGLWNAPGHATYALKMQLPINGPLLGIQVPDVYSSYQLTINGQYTDIKGYAADNKEDAIPFRLIKIFPIPPDMDSVEVVFHVSNYRHSKGGFKKPVIIGDLIYLNHQLFLSRTFDTFIGGCLMMGFFFFLGLYLYGKHDKTSLFFALFCLSYAIRTCFAQNYMINLMIPTFPWDLQVSIEYCTLYFNTIFFTYFVYYLFPGVIPKWLIKFFAIESSIFILFVLFTPPVFFTSVNSIHLVLILAGMGGVTFLFLRSAYLQQKDWVYSLLSIIGFLIIVGIQALDYFDIAEEILLITFIGQIIFFLSNALVLSNHYSRSWREAAVKAKQSEEAKSNFLSVMSHEIRTPLNSLIGTTQFLIEHGPKKEQISELKNLKLSADNLLNIINNILDFNKMESDNLHLETTNVNLHEFLHHMTEQSRKFAEEKGLELSAEMDANISIVQLDETRLIQILGNLISNAVKFTDSGKVKVRVEMVTVNRTKKIRFCVTDTGIGIDKKEQKRILDPFQQVSSSNSRQYGGTGLGLTITKKLLNLMQSDLIIESQPGQGSSFYFTLDYIEGSPSDIPSPLDEHKDLHNAQILLVDDHDLNVLMTTNFLHKWNSQVTVASAGSEALQLVNDNDFDIILMDIQMPGMDGFEATSRIRKLGYSKPIIAVTADVYQKAESITDKGMNGQVIKPFNPDELYKTIKSHLEINVPAISASD